MYLLTAIQITLCNRQQLNKVNLIIPTLRVRKLKVRKVESFWGVGYTVSVSLLPDPRSFESFTFLNTCCTSFLKPHWRTAPSLAWGNQEIQANCNVKYSHHAPPSS